MATSFLDRAVGFLARLVETFRAVRGEAVTTTFSCSPSRRSSPR